ncbi:UbiH/UbiF family hydroxylase [Marinibacterium profundimaris]|uniref:2-octaprenyl-6-methoxyphenyl hydroxylase n=1 Tax=Marinibacterium profundimaris TaxID=1679460 RepID=A0A225NGC3_9RHOB|nr:UbiH/UbiF family hydroxylase [Marinibacterium profundimaris]OWU72628.1 2-octaprenyl-6-methoxyphenyl hydroxylase [Marinibacterium profundimaris]
MAETCDILVSGGGVAGLTAAAAFGSAGFQVICVDPALPVSDRDAEGADLRTTAILQPGRALMETAGLWAHLAPFAMPLQVMRIVDAGGPEGDARVIRDFDAADISDQPFGWNLPNWLLRREMVARLSELPTVDFRPGTGTRTLLTREAEARVGLTDGTQVRARLVVAADGRNSPMRQAAGIDVQTRRYGQTAMVFAVTHAIPHQNVSTEVHRSGGPFTLVPLPDQDSEPSSAVVWMEDGRRARELMALEAAAFEAAMTDRSAGILGPLRLASKRQAWPIIALRAGHLTAQRLALMAEAAHVIPPIGAQGLNMSLGDLQCLLDLATAAPETLGNQTMLDTYARRRHMDISLRITGVDLLNRASMLPFQPLKDLRARGVEALHDITPIRRALMELGLGLR